jgi:CubicO group peptidase (beta-lactamase class C family)
MRTALLGVATTLALVSAPAVHADKVDDYLRAQMERRHVPGLAVAVVRDGKPVKLKGYGVASAELKAPVTKDTAFELASVTKQFTAAAVMLLAEDGKLGLEDPISKHLEGLPEAWQPVTVRQLLDHTSGIRSYTSVPALEFRKDYTKDELLKLVRDAPPDFKPGERWSYNNTGYFLLGMLIEKASGREYGTFLRERIFQPLGMHDTRLNDRSAVIPNRARGHSWRDGALRNGEYVSPTQPYSAGALVSTVADMAKWDAALTQGSLFKKETLEQMWTPAKLNDGKPTTYGLGWQVDTYRTRKRISHGGGIPGFSTNIMRFPEDRLSVIVLANSDSAIADSLASGVAALYSPELAKNAPKSIPDNDRATTERLRGVVTAILEGTAKPDAFTEQAQRQLFPERIRGARGFLGEKARVVSVNLVAENTVNGMKERVYRADLSGLTVRCRFMLAPDGKIAALGFSPAD